MYIPRMYPHPRGIHAIRFRRISLERILTVLVLLLVIGDCIDRRFTGSSSNNLTAAKPHSASMNSLLVLAKESSSETVMDPRKVLHVDPNEFAQQIAISAIVNEEHEITDHRVTFKRDPTKKGTAIQQFARVFGNAIEQGVKPLQEQN